MKWSEVYSQDMFETRFNKEGLLNSKTGLDYRKMILEPGGSIVIPFLYSNKLNMHFIVKFNIHLNRTPMKW